MWIDHRKEIRKLSNLLTVANDLPLEVPGLHLEARLLLTILPTEVIEAAQLVVPYNYDFHSFLFFKIYFVRISKLKSARFWEYFKNISD